MLKLKNRKLWENQVEINSDPYGSAIINVARKVMERIDEKQYKPVKATITLKDDLGRPFKSQMVTFDAKQLITDVNKDLDAGITGFMAGAIANMVWSCHVRGEEFRQMWNGEYSKDRDKEGIINPALMTISV